MNLEDLKAPFDPNDVEWRIGRSGINGGGKVWALALAYLQNRAVMNRLDEVCGPENWKNEFKEWNVGGAGVLCGISVKVRLPTPVAGGSLGSPWYNPVPADGLQWASEWVTKWDGAPVTDFEPVKGGLSDAMKRCAVQWGIGRYLYSLEETFVETSLEKRQGWKYAKMRTIDAPDKAFWWKEPVLPSWALPTVKTDDVLSDEQVANILALLHNGDLEPSRFLAWASKASKQEIVDVSEIPRSLYQKSRDMLEAEGSKT